MKTEQQIMEKLAEMQANSSLCITDQEIYANSLAIFILRDILES